MYRFHSDLNYRVKPLKAGALACVAGLHLAVVAAIVAGPASSARPAVGMPEQVSVVELLPASAAQGRQLQQKQQVQPEQAVSRPAEPRVEQQAAQGKPEVALAQRNQDVMRRDPPTPQIEKRHDAPDEAIKPVKLAPEPELEREPAPRIEPVLKPREQTKQKARPASGNTGQKVAGAAKVGPESAPKVAVLPRKTAASHRKAAEKAVVPTMGATNAAENDRLASALASLASGPAPGSTQAAPVAAPTKPHWISRVAYQGRPPSPDYPRAALRRGQAGEVIVRVLISPQGNVVSAKVYKSSGHELLDDAALDAVRETRFRPYTENGVAYSARADVPIAFVL